MSVARGWRLALVALVSLHAGVLLYHVVLTVAFPYDLDYGEGYVLFDAVRLARGEPLYTDLRAFPMVRSPYPPLFPAAFGLATLVAGPVFWPGRLLAAVALAAVVGLVAWSGLRVRAGGLPALVSAGVVVASPFVYQWAGYARVDTLALAFSVGAVVAAQWLAGWRGVLLAAALALLALWTKQTSVAAPAAIALALFARAPRQAVGFMALVALPSVGAGLLLDRLTDGQFARHVLAGNAQNPFYVRRVLEMGLTFLGLHLVLVAGALWWTSRAIRGVPSPIALYAPLALLVATSVGNAGSSVNYFLEPIAACALAVPFAWRALAARVRLPALLASVQLVALLHWPNTFGTEYLFFPPHGRTPTVQDLAAGAEVDAAVRAEPRAVLAEPAGFAVRNGRPVYVQPIDLRAEAALGRWRAEPLLRAVEAEFGLVVEAYGLLPFELERLLAAEWGAEGAVAGANGLVFRLLRPR